MEANCSCSLVWQHNGDLLMHPLLTNSVPFFSRRSMAATAIGSDIYFFGGVGANTGTESILDVSNDLWRFDTKELTWHGVAVNSIWPSPRRCVGWRSCNEGIYLWGGSGLKNDIHSKTTYNFLNDLWFFDPAKQTWLEIEASDDHTLCPLENSSQPPPRYALILHEDAGTLFLFGGYTEDRLAKRKMNDLWIRDEKGAWSEISS